MKSKKAQANYGDIFVFIVMSVVIVLFFGLMYFGFSKINIVLGNVDLIIGDGQGYNNFTNIVDVTWGEVYDSYDSLKTLSYVLIFGMLISILLGSWLVQAHPIFLVFYIISSIGGVIVSAYVSNMYQGLLTNAEFGATLVSFKGASYMILYLPYLSAVIGLIGALIMFISLNKNKTRNEVPI